MIDTLHFRLTSNHIGKLDSYYQNTVSGNEKRDFGNTPTDNYNIRNFKITCKKTADQYTIKFKGSLHKFIHAGINFSNLTHKDVKAGIEELSNLSGLNLSQGIITRIDVGGNISLTQPVINYMILLDEIPRFKKDTINNLESIYFKKKRIQLVFYNKFNELNREQRRHYASILNDMHLIRYELRLLKKLAKTLNINREDFILNDLLFLDTYKSLIGLWYKEFKKIHWLTINIQMQYHKSIHDFLECRAINELGGIGNVNRLIDAWVKISNQPKKYKSAIVKSLRKKMAADRSKRGIIKELKNKIKFIRKRVCKINCVKPGQGPWPLPGLDC